MREEGTSYTLKEASTVTAVTLAPTAFARESPCRTALCESSEPSVGIRMCRYMWVLPISRGAMGTSPAAWAASLHQTTLHQTRAERNPEVERHAGWRAVLGGAAVHRYGAVRLRATQRSVAE